MSASSSSRYRPSGRSSPASAVSTRSAAWRKAATRAPAVDGLASPRAQLSSNRQNARAAASTAVSWAISRRDVPSSACAASASAQSGIIECPLDLDDDRQDHRPPARAVVDELPDPVVQVLLEQLDLADVVGKEAADD